MDESATEVGVDELLVSGPIADLSKSEFGVDEPFAPSGRAVAIVVAFGSAETDFSAVVGVG